MTCNELIQDILEYIDKRIKENLSVCELAKAATFSEPHFFRLFLGYTDITPMKYVMRRKLFYAAKEIVSTHKKIVDIAFSYGFESHDVFTRAFKRHYGTTPALFRKNGMKLDILYRESTYCDPSHTIALIKNRMRDGVMQKPEYEVKVVKFPKTLLIGVERMIGGDEFVWDAFYRNFDKLFKNAPNRKYPSAENGTHALCELLPRNSKGKWDWTCNFEYNYFAGVEVTSFDDVPEGAAIRILPEQLCAVIDFENDADMDYDSATGYIYKNWLEKSMYKIDFRYNAPWEIYTPNNSGLTYKESVCVPIREMDCEIVEMPGYSGVYVRYEDESWSNVKQQAFEAMQKWAIDNDLFGPSNEVKFEVYNGSTADHNVFFEVFYRADKELPMCEGMRRKTYPPLKYLRSSNVHHSLEPNSRAILRYINQQVEVKHSKSGDFNVRDWFEEYKIGKAGVDFYTPIDVYIHIE